MVLDLGCPRRQLSRRPETEVILLDTNAVIWLDREHPRSRPLRRLTSPLYASPATLLELRFLHESGRIRLPHDTQALAGAGGWVVDDPPAADWFAEAHELTWTRDPFDRLIAAHAQLRGWRVATGDAACARALGPRRTLEL